MKSLIVLWLTLFSVSTLLAFGPTIPGMSPAEVDLGPRPADNELIIYCIPAPRQLVWKNPRRLLGTFMSNYAMAKESKGGTHAIGHVFMGLNVGGREVLAGMTTKDHTEDQKLMKKKGYGLGIIGADMLGRLQTTEKLIKQIPWLCQHGRFGYIRYKISPEIGQRLMQYFDEYVAKGCDKHYGGMNRPRYGEGGGCSAFGVSFLEVAGLVKEEHFANWTINVRIPEKLYGGPYTGRHISMTELAALGPFASSWAKEDEPHIKCFMWEPTLMYLWILKQWNEGNGRPSKGRRAENFGSAFGIVIDETEAPVPTEDIWLCPQSNPNPYGWQPGIYWSEQSETD